MTDFGGTVVGGDALLAFAGRDCVGHGDHVVERPESATNSDTGGRDSNEQREHGADEESAGE